MSWVQPSASRYEVVVYVRCNLRYDNWRASPSDDLYHGMRRLEREDVDDELHVLHSDGDEG